MFARLSLLVSRVLLSLWFLFWSLVIGEDLEECPCPRCELRRMAENGDDAKRAEEP